MTQPPAEIDDEGNAVLADIDHHIQEAKNKLAESTPAATMAVELN